MVCAKTNVKTRQKVYCNCGSRQQAGLVKLVCVDRFFVPKHARRESEFFKELKRQDLCHGREGQEEHDGGAGKVDDVVARPGGVDNTQLTSVHLSGDETLPATTAAAAGRDNVTSLQPCTFIVGATR